MAKSSINFAKGSSHSFIHNDRAEAVEPDYLLPVEHRLGNECNRSASEAQALFDRWFDEAKENYQATYGQKFQGKKENGHWEAAINLNKEHTLADVERLVKEIEKETGFRAMQISIHRDEGHINERGQPIYNLHAHVDFFTFDQDTGRQLYRRSISNSERQRIRKEQGIPDGEPIPKHLTAVIDREKLSKLQDITARELKMVRGKKGSDAVHLKPKQKRAVEKEKAQIKEQITNLTDENAQLRYNFREAQKRITALENLDAEQKKELHRLNSEINKIKGDNSAKVAELEAKLQEAQKPQHEPINASKIVQLQDEVKLLQIVNKGLENELEKTKSATVPKEPENRAERVGNAIEGYLETLPKSTGVSVKSTELDEVSFYGQAGERAARYSRGEEYAAELVKKHTNMIGKVDKDALIAELGQEFKASSSIMYKGLSLVEDFKKGFDTAKRGFESALKRTEMALKDVFSKNWGKSFDQVQNERTEHERAQKAELVKQKEAEQPFELKRPSRGLSLGR